MALRHGSNSQTLDERCSLGFNGSLLLYRKQLVFMGHGHSNGFLVLGVVPIVVFDCNHPASFV